MSATYPPGTDPGPWTTCDACGASIPCDTSGNPYPHTCTAEGGAR